MKSINSNQYRDLRLKQKSENEVYRIYRTKELFAMLNKADENMGIWKPLATLLFGFEGYDMSSLDNEGKILKIFVWCMNNSLSLG